eukprot:PRCOL_00002818-RA
MAEAIATPLSFVSAYTHGKSATPASDSATESIHIASDPFAEQRAAAGDHKAQHNKKMTGNSKKTCTASTMTGTTGLDHADNLDPADVVPGATLATPAKSSRPWLI